MLDIIAPDQTADQPSPVRIACPCRVLNLPGLLGGDTVYVKDLGDGYAVLSAVQANVDAFTGKSGADSIKSKMGKSGETLADASDVAFVVNMDPLRTYMPEIIAEMQRAARGEIEIEAGIRATIRKFAHAKIRGPRPLP